MMEKNEDFAQHSGARRAIERSRRDMDTETADVLEPALAQMDAQGFGEKADNRRGGEAFVSQTFNNSQIVAGRDIRLYSFSGNLAIHKHDGEAVLVRVGLNQVPARLADLEQTHLKKELNPLIAATHNAYEASHRPTCFPDTRTQILSDIKNWLVGDGDQAPIFVLDGIAGIGKTTVAQTIAVDYGSLDLLVASFFFSRDEELRQIAKHFFPTIIYQLAGHSHALAVRIDDALKQYPDAPQRSLQEQFSILLLQPLQEFMQKSTPPALLIIDALDECEEAGAQTLLATLGQNMHLLPRLKILMTARPEWHIRKFLRDNEHHKVFHLHDVESHIVKSDIYLYLSHYLSGDQVKKFFPNLTPPWQLTAYDLEMLCGICGTLFIIASTVKKFILDPKRSDPRKQLIRLLQGVSPTTFAGSKHTGAVVDAMYLHIITCAIPSDLDEGEDDWFDSYRQVLGAIIVLENPLPCLTLAALLDIPQNCIENTLSQLHSLVAPSGSGLDMTFHIHHKSFPDFITDQKRIKTAVSALPAQSYMQLNLAASLWIDSGVHHLQLAKACFQIMNSQLHWNMANLTEDTWYLDKPDIPHVNAELISNELAYAVLHWASHLTSAHNNSDIEINTYLEIWVTNHILSWIEVLSILDHIDQGYDVVHQSLGYLRYFVDNQELGAGWPRSESIMDLLTDTARFILQAQTILKLSPMHVYWSSLPFVPSETALYRNYMTVSPVRLHWGSQRTWDSTIATLIGHVDYVRSVAFSPDGLIASGSDDRTVRLWDAQTCTPITTFEGHSDVVTSVGFSPDGLQLASGSWDNTIRLWNVQSSAHVATLISHSGWINTIEFSPDGVQLASASDDKTIKIWDARTGVLLTTYKCYSHTITPSAFPFDKLQPGVGPCSNEIWQSNTKTSILITSFSSSHSVDLTSITFSPDGSKLACGSTHAMIWLWDAKTSVLITTLVGDFEYIRQIVFSPNGLQLASVSHCSSVILWDTETGNSNGSLIHPMEKVMSVAFSPDGLQIASACGDQVVRLWDAKTTLPTATFIGHFDEVNSVAFSPDGLQLVSGSNDSTVKLWNAKPNTLITTPVGHSRSILSVAFSPDGLHVVSASRDATVILWNLNISTPITTLADNFHYESSVSISPDSVHLAYGSDERGIILSINTGTLITTLVGHSSAIHSFAFSPDGLNIVSGSKDHTVRVWDAATGTPLMTLTDHTDSVTTVAYSPDGLHIASSSNSFRLWDARTGILSTTLKISFKSFAFALDGLQFASISPGWDFEDTLEIIELHGTQSGIIVATISKANLYLEALSVISKDSPFHKLIRVADVKPGIDCSNQSPFAPSEPSIPSTPSLFLALAHDLQSQLCYLVKVGLTSNQQWELIPFCWLPPYIQAQSFAVHRSKPLVALGCVSGQVLLLDFTPVSSKDPLPQVSSL